MLINSLDLKDKTIFHEVNPSEKFNSFIIMDYLTNTMGKKLKINNGITSTLDYCSINENQILLSYVPAIIDKIVVKICTIKDDTLMDFGPLYTIDELTNTNKISLVKIIDNKFAIIYNDNSNKNCKIVVISIDNDKISTVSKMILTSGVVPEVRAINVMDGEIAVFFQHNKVGIVQLLRYNEGLSLYKAEEQIFYIGSDLWNLTIKKVKDYYVLGFINSDHKLIIKIIEATDNKIRFTHGIQYNIKIVGDFFQMISIDNEMILCYFNNVAQIISLNNGQIIQPENIV